VLRRACALGTGRVRDVKMLSSIKKLRSHTFRLHLAYEGPAEESPSSVILKMGHRGDDGRPSYLNRHELAFYRDIAPALPNRLVPGCFDVAEATETSPWHLLLEDLTDTHVIATEHPLPPAYPTCRSIVQRWGQLHAALWNDPRLEDFLGRPAMEFLAEYLRLSIDRFVVFIDRFSEVVPAERQRLYERLFDCGPRVLKRIEAGHPLTLIHGDAHWWNCFVPRDSHQEQVRLLDWEDWAIGAGTTDLAYMIAMLWFPERRRAMEQPLLDCYYDALLADGVAAYGRQMLDDDYRWSVLLQLLRPIWQATNNLPARVWWPNLERNMLAVEDLGCRELLA
jgi:hypothetical protein